MDHVNSLNLTLLLLVMFFFQIKHFLVDFPLQSYYEILGRIQTKQSWLVPLLTHGFLHGIFTFTIFILAGIIFNSTPTIILAAALGFADGALHALIDSIVLYVGRETEYTLKHTTFVQLFGLDQLFHQLSYVLWIGLFVHFSGIQHLTW